MRTQKYSISLLLLICCIITYSQDFKERHIRKLENLDIPFKTEYSTNEKATKDLHQILHYDFKRKAKNTVGATLLTIGLGGLVGGVVLSREAKYDRHGFTQIAAGGFFVVGAAGISTSIPLFVGARKTSRKRDRLKTLYRLGATHNTIGSVQK